MNEQADALQERTLRFALRATALCRSLPHSFDGRHVADQLFRASTAVAANYRAARHGRSYREFTAKLGTVLEEADESEFWLEFAARSEMADGRELASLLREAKELAAIFTAAVKTANSRQSRHAKLSNVKSQV